MSVSRLLLVVCCIVGLSACAGFAAPARAPARLYRELADWLAVNALPGEVLAVQESTALQQFPVPVLPLPLEGGAPAVLATLQEAHPAYCLASHSVLWDGLQAHPWFVEHYQPVLVSADAHVGFSPLTLFRLTASPFDAGETMSVAVQIEDPAVGILRVEAARLSPAQRIWPGESLNLTLTLQGDVREPLRAVLNLRDLANDRPANDRRSYDRIVFQAVHEQPGGITTDAWFPGRPVEDRFVILPPKDLAPGAYALELAWLRPNGAPFGESIVLAQLTRPAVVASAAQTPDHALRANFGDAIVLLGHDAPSQIAPGATFTVTLYWQALTQMTTDYKVFVHIFAPGGELVAQHDGQPVNWTYPTTVWQAGDFILDRHSLALDSELPRGDYQVFVGFYEAAAPDVRLPAFDAQGAPLAEGHVQLATLRVR